MQYDGEGRCKVHDWRLQVVGHTAMVELLVQNLLLEGTFIACEEVMEAAERLVDYLACLRRDAVAGRCAQGGNSMKRGRSLKVCETGDGYGIQHGGKRNSVPMIRLRGKWLRLAGFSAGQDVTVIVEHQRLTVVLTGREE